MAGNVPKLRTLPIHIFRKVRTAQYGSPRPLHHGPDTVEELLDRHIVKEEKSFNNDDNETLTRQRLTSTRREALSLYRDIIRATRFFMWPDSRGLLWRDILRENTRKEFEEARFERDPEVITRLLIGGRDALQSALDKLVEKQKQEIENQKGNSKSSPILWLGFPTFGIFSSSYTSSSNEQLDNPSLDSKNGDTDYEYCSDSDEDNGNPVVYGSQAYPNESLETIMGILRVPGASVSQVNRQLEQCHVKILPELVSDVLSRVRNDWELAFTFFLWAGKQPGYAHSVREFHSMIAILGKMRKFDTAWALINEMRGGKNGSSFVSPNTLLIMIRRYCAAHDVGKAISTFHAHRRFNLEIGMEEFQKFLSALCRYKNVKAAESLIFSNKKYFPLNTKSFNVILNGWCNVVGDLREGKRIWRLMKEMGVRRDVYSYSSIMSSYSKSTNLKAVLRLFDQMKEYGIAPDRKVYNAVIHALAKERLMKEAQNIMKTMEEKGISPDVVTYNSIIMPMCKHRLLNEAKGVFNEMKQRGITPTVRTYHAFFRILRTEEEVFELLHNMNAMGCHPTHETYIMLIRKFCRWQQLDIVFKLWADMIRNGLDPDRSSYIVLIHGLFLNGKLEDAHKYYLEMKEKDLLPEPKIEEILRAWLASKQAAGPMMTNSTENIGILNNPEKKVGIKSKKMDRQRDFFRHPENRVVTKERGFSFWDK